MGREIEIKIPLTSKEFDRLYDFLCSKFSIEGIQIIGSAGNPEDRKFFLKKDEYFSKYAKESERRENNEPQVIRIRTQNFEDGRRSFFTIKRKVVEDGIEVNKEDETYIEDADVLRDFFALAGYSKWFSKEKKACGVFCTFSLFEGVTFHLELETVNEMKYVEIEVTDTDGSAKDIKTGLTEFVKALNLNPQKKDSRSWVEIIRGNKFR